MISSPQRRALAIATEALRFRRQARQDLEVCQGEERRRIIEKIFVDLEPIDGEREAEQIILDMATEAGDCAP